MSGDGVKDMEGVAYRADVDTGQGRLLVHWEEEGGRVGGRMIEQGETGKYPTLLLLNEFRVFIQDWSALRFDATKKEKREGELAIRKWK